MDLIKIQDGLNKLPPSPQTVQYLMQAAQGAVPHVPPYMALARLGEVKKEMDSSQQGQAAGAGPQGTVKDQIMGSFMPPQLRQMMPGQGAGMPQPQMNAVPPQGALRQTPMQMPTQQQARPPQAGLAALMQGGAPRRYKSGGIVALAGGGEPPAPTADTSWLTKLSEMFERVQKTPEPDRAAQYEEELKKRGLDKPGGAEYETYQRQTLPAEYERQRTDAAAKEEQLKRRALFEGLLAAGEASRGAGSGLAGIGALASGFGKSYSGYLGAADARQAAAEQARMKQEADRQKELYLLEKARREESIGNLDAATKLRMEADKIRENRLKLSADIGTTAAQVQESGNQRVWRAHEAALERAKDERVARIGADARIAGRSGGLGDDNVMALSRLASRLREEIALYEKDPRHMSPEIREAIRVRRARLAAVLEVMGEKVGVPMGGEGTSPVPGTPPMPGAPAPGAATPASNPYSKLSDDEVSARVNRLLGK